MDKVRLIVSVIWRERFWVLTVLGVIVAVACWYMSSGELDKEFASRKSAITSTISSMRTLSQEIDHPNDKVIDGDKVQARVQRDNTLKQWESLYATQKEEVLKWPADNLKPEFIEAIEQLKFRDPLPANLRENMRAHYWNYIGKRFDGMLEIVKALKMEGSGGRSGGGSRFGGEEFGRAPMMRPGMNGEEIEEDYIVQWLDQDSLREKLDFSSKPTTLQIWVTQEDLWVYETLLNVIANTNKAENATRPDNAVVRTILTLEVGKEAAMAIRQPSQILMPGGGSEGGEGRREFMGSEGASEYMGGGREEFMGGGGRGFPGGGGESEITDEMVLAGRYLNAEGEPTAEPEDPEFRRLPIHMKLQMDQRSLPYLLVECANAALPVEVEQVKVNPEKSGGSFSTGSGRFGGGGRGQGEFARMAGGMEGTMPNPNLATIDIQGVVYIYNEPNKSVLSLPGLEEENTDNQQAANPTPTNLR